MARNLLRSSKILISTVNTGHTSSNTFELPPLDGYSFSQAPSTEDISVSEAGTAPIRGVKTYNIALDPVEFSIPTYAKPYLSGSNHTCVERLLWEALVGTGPINTNTTSNATSLSVDFLNSNVNQLFKLYIYFILDNVTYRIDNAVINTAEIGFDIEDIAKITWSGFADAIAQDSTTFTAGTNYLEAAPLIPKFITNKLSVLSITDNTTSTPSLTSTASAVSNTVPAAPVVTGQAGDIPSTNAFVGGFIKFTAGSQSGNSYEISATNATTDAITLVGPYIGTAPANGVAFEIYSANAHSGKVYNVPLTGGSMTITNNVTFLTPEELGVVNVPLDHFTGSRDISGNITAYLNTGQQNTADLLAMLAADTTSVSQSFNMTLKVGGATGARVEVALPTAHVSIPTIGTDSVLTTDMAFKAQGSTGIDALDEANIKYFAQ